MKWEPTLRAYTRALKRLDADKLSPSELRRTIALLDALHPVMYGALPTGQEEAYRTKLLLKAFDEILLGPAKPRTKVV
ncbi:MAG: hypothetical protein AAB424_04045 [Patescibacteria group bacterium]